MTSVSCRSLAYSHSSLPPGDDDDDYDDGKDDDDDNNYDDDDDNDDDNYDDDNNVEHLPLCGRGGSRALHADCPA